METNDMQDLKLVVRADSAYEQVVFAEVLVPEVANVYGDFWTRTGIKEAAYLFMRVGFGIDVEHDNIDLTGSVYVVESFIARDSDPDFIPGSWVVGMKIEDGDLWQQVLDNEINGFSYEAIVAFLGATLRISDDGVRTGVTEAADDGHVHTYMVMVDADGRPSSGGTSTENGHSHQIVRSTHTEDSDGHSHRYTMITGGTTDD